MLQRRRFFSLLAGIAGSIFALTRVRPASLWKSPARVQAAPPMDAQSTTSTENQSGIKVTTVHRSTSGFVGGDVSAWSNEVTFYAQGKWRRYEEPRSSTEKRKADGCLARVYGPRIVSIARHDLRQQFDLNLDASEYSQRSLDWLYSPPEPLEKLRGLTEGDLQALGIKKMPPPRSEKVETVTKDTGERKEMFGYLARHVIATTLKESSLEGSHRETQETTRDGWYINLEPQFYPVLYPSLLLMHSASCKSAKPELALRELQITRMTITTADGVKGEYESRNENIVSLEKGTYDAALFEVPSGFKCVTQINRSIPS